MIDITELKNESKHAVGFKNNFYKLKICYPNVLNDVKYSFYSWKSKVDLMNSNRLCSKTIEMEILSDDETENGIESSIRKRKGIEFIFDNYSGLMSFVRKYNDTYRKGYTPFFLKVIYKKQTSDKTLLSLDYKFF
jgi:hypothetical protein